MSGWDRSEYGKCVGEKGHYYHQSVVLPESLRLLAMKEGSLLDLGCGQGVLARHLPDKVEYWGVDLSKKLIEEAKKRTGAKKNHFLVGDAAKISLEKKDFDTV